MPTPTAAERDFDEANASAHRVLGHVIEATEGTPPQPPAVDTRNAAAVALGKLGASKGGKARAESLTKARRKAIAKKAAKSRWSKPE
jgi:hypothetical protein